MQVGENVMKVEKDPVLVKPSSVIRGKVNLIKGESDLNFNQ